MLRIPLKSLKHYLSNSVRINFLRPLLLLTNSWRPNTSFLRQNFCWKIQKIGYIFTSLAWLSIMKALESSDIRLQRIWLLLFATLATRTSILSKNRSIFKIWRGSIFFVYSSTAHTRKNWRTPLKRLWFQLSNAVRHDFLDVLKSRIFYYATFFQFL